MLPLGGLVFEIQPRERLSPAEQAYLGRLSGPPVSSSPPFRIELSPNPPWSDFDPDSVPPGQPASVDWIPDRVLIRHREFGAELQPHRSVGRLFRRTEHAYALEATLRVALCSRLPLEGGLPLHAAGLAMRGQGVVFFGPSGAGKSTLAGLSPFPVLSDELVAVVPGRPFDLVRSGFFGTLGKGDDAGGAFPLAALVELDKGPAFALTPLPPRAALRRLLGAILVPVGPPLWEAALAAAGRLCREVPTYRLSWSPSTPPWERLTEALPRRGQYLTAQP